jgi:hypothetical protein
MRERAIRERWAVPAELITETLYQVQEILATAGSERHIVAAARVVLEAVKADLAADKLDMERAKLAPPKETQARDAWSDLLGELGSADSPGVSPGPAGGIPIADPGSQPLE